MAHKQMDTVAVLRQLLADTKEWYRLPERVRDEEEVAHSLWANDEILGLDGQADILTKVEYDRQRQTIREELARRRSQSHAKYMRDSGQDAQRVEFDRRHACRSEIRKLIREIAYLMG